MTSAKNSLNSYKIIGIFFSYPSQEWIKNAKVLFDILKQENAIKLPTLKNIELFVEHIQTKEILESQEYYVRLFDRSRDISLYLFEHVHGESKDRGQAMLDLLDMYEQHGLELDKKELPDYLPLFLEFLSFLPLNEAKEFLTDCVHIIAKIATSLSQRDSIYVPLFNGLMDLAGHSSIEWKSPTKDINDWMYTMDDEWEEEQVKFLNNDHPKQTATKKCGGCSCGGEISSADQNLSTGCV
ncbi:MAG: nitrate reductase molybdenum cofactor assembly chaperone [Alphaproteobacteria bacterium]